MMYHSLVGLAQCKQMIVYEQTRLRAVVLVGCFIKVSLG